MSDIERLLNEEKKMIGFLADRIWDIMNTPEMRRHFSDEDVESVEAIWRHFSSDYQMRLLNKESEGWWDKTK